MVARVISKEFGRPIRSNGVAKPSAKDLKSQAMANHRVFTWQQGRHWPNLMTAV
jgi:hypothetical protein